MRELTGPWGNDVKITTRLRLGPREIRIRPILVVLLGTGAEVAAAATPAAPLRWPQQQQSFAARLARDADQLSVAAVLPLSSMQLAIPCHTDVLRTPDAILRSISVAMPAPLAGSQCYVRPVTNPVVKRGDILSETASLAVDRRRAAAQEPLGAVPAQSLSGALPPDISDASLIDRPIAAALSSSLKTEAIVARLVRQEFSKVSRLRRALPAPAASSALIRSQVSGVSLTERGIEFATAAFVNGNSAGNVKLLIADGANISVRLGDILALVAPLVEKTRYEALRTSRSANQYVTLTTLRTAGIAARLDAHDQLILGGKSRFAGSPATLPEPEERGGLFKGPVAVGLYAGSLTESPDGSSITHTTTWTLLADTTVKHWKLSVDASYKVARGMTPSTAEQERSGLSGKRGQHAMYRTAGLTDTRVSAERSFPLAGKIKLDLLARATLPTGERGTQRARGRYEMLVDAGLSARVGPADVWLGAGHRFRSAGYYTPGRDITEVYAGTELGLGGGTTVRADFVSAQSPFRGEAQEYSLSTGLSHGLSSNVTLDFTVLAYRDVYGKGVQGGLAVRMPLTSF